MARKLKQLLLSWGGKKTRPLRSNNKPERDDVRPPAKGRIWVRVGRDEASLRKLEVEAHFLDHPLFGDLLRLSEDEFGHSYAGALRIACDAGLFLSLVDLLRSGNPAVHYMELPDLLTHAHSSGAGVEH